MHSTPSRMTTQFHAVLPDDSSPCAQHSTLHQLLTAIDIRIHFCLMCTQTHHQAGDEMTVCSRNSCFSGAANQSLLRDATAKPTGMQRQAAQSGHSLHRHRLVSYSGAQTSGTFWIMKLFAAHERITWCSFRWHSAGKMRLTLMVRKLRDWGKTALSSFA